MIKTKYLKILVVSLLMVSLLVIWVKIPSVPTRPEQEGLLTLEWQQISSGNWNFPPVIIDVNNDGIRDVIYGIRDENKVKARNGSDGTLIWETTMTSPYAPSIGDINEDGTPEIVVGGNPYLYVLRLSDGAILDSANLGGKLGQSAAIIDIDGNSGKEIMIGRRHSYYYMLDQNLDIVWSSNPAVYDACGAHPAIIDVANDDILDLFIGSLDTNGRLIRFNTNTFTNEWRVLLGDSNAGTASPVLVDIDNDGLLEILKSIDSYHGTGSDNKLFAFETNGTEIWNYTVNEYRSPNAADMDGDGDVEIVGISTDGELYLLDKDGQEQWKIDISSGSNNVGYAILADVDGDFELEIIASTVEGVKVYDINGNLLYHYSLNLPSSYGPVLANLDNDPYSEIVVSSRDGFYVLQTKGYNAEQDLITSRKDYRRNAVYKWEYEDTYFLHKVTHTNTKNVADGVELIDRGGGTYINGTLQTQNLKLPSSDFSWDTLTFDSDEPSGTDITVDVYNTFNDQVLLSGVISGTNLNLSTSEIYLKFILQTDGSSTAKLKSYNLAFTKSSGILA